jgi:hypothetical protein
MRKVNEEMVCTFQLQKTEREEARILRAAIAQLWTILVDSTSKGMRGFGNLSPELARELDRHVERLLVLLDRIHQRT